MISTQNMTKQWYTLYKISSFNSNISNEKTANMKWEYRQNKINDR